MVDVPVDTPLVSLIKAGEGNLLVAASTGHGLIIDLKSAMAQTRSGKQVLNLSGNARAVACCVASGDHVAVVGQNRRLLVFKLDEVPQMQRGKGVILQRYKDGDLSDIKVFTLADGLSWQMGGGAPVPKQICWLGRASGAAGKLLPMAFRVRHVLPEAS